MVGECGGEKGLEGRLEVAVGLGGVARRCRVGGGSLDEASLGLGGAEMKPIVGGRW